MNNIFNNGIPTEPDVKLLLKAFPAILPEEFISYNRVEEIIDVKRDTSRFTTVTKAWRRHLLRTENFVLEVVPKHGFRRRTELERSEKDRTGWRQDQSRAARKVRDLSRTETSSFSDRDLSSHNHARRVLQAHVEHTSSTVREIAPPTPQKQLRKGT